MRLSSLILGAALVACPLGMIAWCDDAPERAVPLAERVGGLVEALDAPRRSERREAERALLELGPGALPFLPPPDRLESAAVRETVRRIRRQLEMEKARESIGASTVTFRGRTTLSRLVAEITRQTGNALDVSGLPPERLDEEVDVDLENVAFWPCLDGLLAERGLLSVSTADGQALRLEPRPAAVDREPVAYSGAFRIELDSLRRRPYFGDDEHDLARATVEVRAEPRLRPLFAKYRGDGVAIRVAENRAFAPLNADAVHEPPVTRGTIAPRWDVLLPNNDALEMANVAGELALVVAAGSETIPFPPLDKATNVERRRGGVVVRTTRSTFAESRAEVEVSVAYDTGGPAFESHRTWIYDAGARLERGKEGRHDPVAPPTVSRSSDGAIGLRYRFDELEGNAGDYRFVYVLPTLVVETTIDFEWKDVPVEQPLRVGTDE